MRKISIIPRGRALGVTFQSPDADRYGYTDEFLRGRLAGMLGGRAAEEVVYGDLTTGAESDLEQATRIARQMVGRWGMSDQIGLVSVLPGPNDEPTLFPVATTASRSAPASWSTTRPDGSSRRLTAPRSHTLSQHRDQLEALARALLEHETLDELDAYRIAGIERDPIPAPSL